MTARFVGVLLFFGVLVSGDVTESGVPVPGTGCPGAPPILCAPPVPKPGLPLAILPPPCPPGASVSLLLIGLCGPPLPYVCPPLCPIGVSFATPPVTILLPCPCPPLTFVVPPTIPPGLTFCIQKIYAGPLGCVGVSPASSITIGC